MEKNTKILIIEDHEMIVWALKTRIKETLSDISIFWAPTFEQGLDLLKENWINLVILDIDIPGGNSPKMIPRLRGLQPAVPILVHSALPEEKYALPYLTAGADGFLSKKSPLNSLSKVLSLVLNGKKYISPQTKDVIADNFLQDPPKKTVAFDLLFSPRELDVLRLLLKGQWTKEIADELNIKASTVSTHKLSIFVKLGVSNYIELFTKVQREMPELLD